MENNIQKLLNEVKVILQQEKIIKEESRKRGEQFNIFEVLGLQTSEVRLHSAFLAELLNPNGDHGLNNKFLKVFVEDIVKNCKSFDFDTESAQVFPEFSIGDITEDYQEGGRIDLYIQDKNNQIIIVENKIDALDQPYQLLRYHNYAERSKELPQEKFTLLYLTPNGKKPSERSVGTNQFEYFCISYRTHILNWLEKCVELSARHPLIRETIQQYIINLKNILSIMDNSNKEELFKIMASNANAVVAIVSAINDRQYVYNTFVKPKLIEFSKSKIPELIFEESNLFAGKKERGFYFRMKDWKHYAIWFYAEHQGEWGFCWGISNYEGDTLHLDKFKLSCIDCPYDSLDDTWPYGKEYLTKYSNWGDTETILAMVNGDYVKYITDLVSKALDEIDKNNLPMP